MSAEYGIVVSKNVMVAMRDGVRLAFDIYRPARDGDFVDGRFPTIMLHTPYDKTDKRYTEIADFFVPKGYNVVLSRPARPLPLRGLRRLLPRRHAAHGRDGYDICEWIAAQPWSNGRIGTVGSSYGAITQVRTALERPPHLTAIWPDVVPTNSFQNQCREGGAMQGHMFWALFIHAQDAQDIADDPEQAAGRLERPPRPPAALPGDAVAARPDVAAARAAARGDADRLLHARRLRRVLEPDRARLHALLGPARRRPGHVLDRLVRPVPRRRLRVLRLDGGEEHGAAAARDRPLEPRRDARRRDLLPRRRLRARRASGASSGTSRSSSSSSAAGSPTTRPGSPTARRPCGSS